MATPGHASVPMPRGNAVVGAADVIRALHEYEPRLSLETVPREYVELLVEDRGLSERLLDEAAARAALAELRERDKKIADLLAPLYGISFSPTIVHSSGEAVNVFPQRAEVTVDCRMPVGWRQDQVLAEIECALAGVDARWEIEFIGTVYGNASPSESPLRDAVTAVMGRLVPGSRIVPIHSAGFTDSNWFRTQFPDIVAYNFAPFVVDDADAVSPLFHNVDERINVQRPGVPVAVRLRAGLRTAQVAPDPRMREHLSAAEHQSAQVSACLGLTMQAPHVGHVRRLSSLKNSTVVPHSPHATSKMSSAVHALRSRPGQPLTTSSPQIRRYESA